MPPELPLSQPGGDIAVPRPTLPGFTNEALAGAAQGADKMQDLALHFARLQHVNQFNQADAEWDEGKEDILRGPTGVLNNPAIRDNPAAVQAEVKTRLDGLTSSLIQKYPAANLGNAFTRQVGVRTTGALRQGFQEAHLNLEKSTIDGLQAGLNARLNQSLTAVNPQDRVYARLEAHNTIDNAVGAGLVDKGQGELLHQKFESDYTNGAFTALATSDPASVLRMTAVPPGVNPTTFALARTRALGSIEQPGRIVQAQLSESRAANDQSVLQDHAAGRPIDPGKIEGLRGQDQLSDDVYRLVAGHGFRDVSPSAPGVAENFTSSIKGALTADELAGITENLKWAQAANTISSKDAAALTLAANHRASELKTDEGAAKAQSWSDAFALIAPAAKPRPGSPAALMAAMRPGGGDLVINQERYRAAFEASWLAHKGDQTATMKDMRQFVTDALKSGPATPGASFMPPAAGRGF